MHHVLSCCLQGKKPLASSEETAMRLYNLERLELITDPLTSTKCLVAWGQDTIVVAFRGTANRQNAAYDLKVRCSCTISVHKGSKLQVFVCLPPSGIDCRRISHLPYWKLQNPGCYSPIEITILLMYVPRLVSDREPAEMQAWLVPHIPEEAAQIGCGTGSTAAVHQGFNVSWGNALKKDVCDVIQQAVKQSGTDASRMRVFVTGG